MKCKWKISYILATLTLSCLTMGVEFEGSWTKVLESLPALGVETIDFEDQPKVYVFSKKEGNFLPIFLESKLLKQNQRTLISLEDANAIIQQKKIHFDEKTNILTIQQIKRIYLAVDKSSYLEQNKLKPTSVAPVIREGRVYIPLRFVFEKLGYTVNFNEFDREILVIPSSQNNETIVAKDRIKKSEIEQEESNLNRVEILGLSKGAMLGHIKGEDGSQRRLIRVGKDGGVSISEDTFPGESKLFSGDENGLYYTHDGWALYSLDMTRGLIDKISIPRKLEGAYFFSQDKGRFYGQLGKEIYSFNPSNKKISKIFEASNLSWLMVEEEILYAKEEGKLISYDPKKGEYNILMDLGPSGSFEIKDISHPYVYYYNYKRSSFEVLNLEEDKLEVVIPFNEKSSPEINICDKYSISIEKKNSLYLYDLLTKSEIALDLTNLKEDLNRGNIRWFWNGYDLLGHWKYDIELEEAIKDQIIEIQK